MKRIIISVALAIAAILAGLILYTNLQRSSGFVGITLDSPSNNLSTLSISILAYQTTYERCPESLKVLGPPAPGERADARTADLVRADLAGGTHAGYSYEYQLIREGKSCEFTIHADPAEPGLDKLYYYMDETVVKRFAVGSRASVTSPQYQKDN